VTKVLVEEGGNETAPTSLQLLDTNTLPTLASVGHQKTESTSTGCNQWLSLAKITLKVSLDGRNRLLVVNTSKCGKGIR
jgi:hypothetical protein